LLNANIFQRHVKVVMALNQLIHKKESFRSSPAFKKVAVRPTNLARFHVTSRSHLDTNATAVVPAMAAGLT